MPVCAETYERLLARVEKPGRYLGNELGVVRKDPGAVAVRFALAFPEVYEIAQSHPGLQLLYDLLNRRQDTYAERVYAPWVDLEAVLRQAGHPLVSLEAYTPLRSSTSSASAAVRAHVHQRADHARPRRPSPARRRARPGEPLKCVPATLRLQPRASPTSSTRCCSATARRRSTACATSTGAGIAAIASPAGGAGRPGVYVPGLLRRAARRSRPAAGGRADPPGLRRWWKRILRDLDHPLAEAHVVNIRVVHGRPGLGLARIA
ncbi:MAG: hypothetical protein U0802_15960 [Candidatus Binatia bacterium]